MDIEPLNPERRAAVGQFNERLRQAGVTFQFPESPDGLMQPLSDGTSVRQHAFVLVDGATVRGGYILKDETFQRRGNNFDVGNYQLPLSEGIVDRRYSLTGLQLLRDALKRQPRLYCLGMGSVERPLPIMLSKLGWKVDVIPFFFFVNDAQSFLDNIEFLKARPKWRAVLNVLRISRIGNLGVAIYKSLARIRGAKIPAGLSVVEIKQFGPEADQVFERCAELYAPLSDRRAAALNAKLPSSDPRLVRLVLFASSGPVGWIVVSCSNVRNHKQFGNMRLGCIVDGLGDEAALPWLVRAASDRLIHDRAALVVTNQSAKPWIDAIKSQGFLTGPSNFVLARSPAMIEALGSAAGHFTRCDGDGPINL